MTTDRPATGEEIHTADLFRDAKGAQQRDEQDAESDSTAQDEAPVALLDDAPRLESKWNDIQASFVDEPRRAVENADMLVAEVMRRLAESFATERDRMEGDWQAGEDVSTDDLRVALQRYRSFFQRLLAA